MNRGCHEVVTDATPAACHFLSKKLKIAAKSPKAANCRDFDEEHVSLSK
jgi:hypothetical protein